MAWRQKLNNAVDKYKPSVPSQVAAIAQVTKPEGGIGQTNDSSEDRQSRSSKPASASTLGNLSDSVEDTLRQLEAFAQSLNEAGRPDEIAQAEASRAREKLRKLSPSLGLEFAPGERGLLVTKCVPGEAGERSGFRVGDVLVKIGTRAAKEDKALRELKAGDTVAVELERRQSELVVNLFTLRLKVGATGVPFADLEAIVDAAAFPENHKGPVPERWAGLVDGPLVQALAAAGAQAEDAHKSISGGFANVMRAGSLVGDSRDARSPLRGDSRLSEDKKTIHRGSSENVLRRNSSVEFENSETKEAEDNVGELAEGDFGTLTESALQESEKLRQMTSLTMPDMTRARSILLWEPTHEDSVSEHSEMESISSEPLDARDGERPSVMMHMPSEPRREVSGPTPPSSDCEEDEKPPQDEMESNDDRPFVDYFLAMSVVPSPAYLARAALHPVDDIGEDTYASVRSRRYPLVDRAGSPMPESVSVFTFGAGAKTIYVHNDGSSEDNQRLAKVAGVVYFAFILTDVHSGRLYASCAQYYTAVPNTAGVYAARTLCFLSRVPFLHSLREALTVLVAMEGCSVDPTVPSPEQLVTHLTEEVRVPRPGGPTVRFMVGGKQLELTMPEERDFPLLDHDLRALFDRLTIDNVLAILVCILTEQKIVVHSSRSVDLTYVTEACLALIFPFRWYHVYIPVLPTALLDVCDAPVPFFVGMQTSLLDSLISETKDRMMLVDLDRNSVKFPRKFKTRMPSKLQASIKQQITALLHPELNAGPRGSTTRRNSSSVSRSIEPEDCTAEGFDQELMDGPLASALALDQLIGGSEPRGSVGAVETASSNDTVPESVAISLTEPDGARGSTSLSLPVTPQLARGESVEVRPPPSLSMGDSIQDLRRNSLSVPDANDSPAPRRDSLSVIDHTSPPIIHTTKHSPILPALSTRRGSFNASPNTPHSPAAARRDTLSEPFPISLGAEVDHELNLAIRKVFLEAFSLLLQDFRQFLFFMGDGVPVFNAEEFVNLHKRRHTEMLETEEPRRSKLKWLGVSQPSPVQPFLCQFLSTHVFAMFLEECQYPSVFHVYLSIRQTQGTRRLALGTSGRSLGCLRVPAPVPHHPYYPTTMTPHHVNTIKKQIKLRRLRPSPVPVVSSSFWRSSKSVAPATHHVPFEPDLSLPFPVRVCDWLDTKREWNVPARSMASLYASQPSVPVPKYLQAKRRREKALRRCQNSESFHRLQTFLSYVFLSTKPEAGKQAERMHNVFLQCKRSLSDKQTRRGLALLLDHPANLVSQKSRLSARKFASMSSLIKKFLDACLKDRDYKSSVSALTAGSTFFCLKRNPRPEHGLSVPPAPPTPDSPRAQSLADFLNAPQSPGSPEGDDEELPEVEGNPEASDPDLLSYFLENSLRDHPIFLHSAFWRKAFREALQKLSLQDELLSFEPEGRQDLVQLLGMMINKMLFFGRSIAFVTTFIREKSVGLSESDSKMLEMLALNIFRAR